MSLTLNLEPIISAEVQKSLASLNLEQKIEELIGVATAKASKIITVKLGEDGEEKKVGVQHKQFENILKLVALGENLMIKGEAGNGKSHVVEQVAKALDLEFHSMSVSNQTTKTDLLGFVDANGVYRYNGFISAFRDGGVFNMDEIDAGNANVLVVLNSALSNGFVEAPNGEMIRVHEKFRFCATANTTGRGATQKYVGRNKLDSATLDRFAVLEFGLDEDIELSLCGGDKDFHRGIKAMRKLCEKNYEEMQISQRSSSRLYTLLGADFELEDALEIAIFKGIDEDIVQALTKSFKNATNDKKFGAKKEVTETSKPEVDEVDEVTETSKPEVDEMNDDDVNFDW